MLFRSFENKSPNKILIENFVKEIQDYKNIILFSPEEFNYHAESISYFIDLCLENNHKIFIYSFNSNVNDFLEIKFPNQYKKNILANSAETLFNGRVINWTVKYNNPNQIKQINLLFLNYNRKPNRDYILSELNKHKQLEKKDNFISFHNNYTFSKNAYDKIYENYFKENNINSEWINNLKLQPEEVDIHNQGDAQYKAQYLHHNAKFNIICEPFCGMSFDKNDYEYYNHVITRKTIYPLLFENIIYVHSHNGVLQKTLKNLGFELFYDNLDEFINNISDDIFYDKLNQEKIIYNKNLLYKYMGNIENAKTHNKYKTYQKLTQEVVDFIG